MYHVPRYGVYMNSYNVRGIWMFGSEWMIAPEQLFQYMLLLLQDLLVHGKHKQY